MRILIIEPHRRPKLREVEDDYKALQKIVGGTVQAIYPWKDNVALLCNDDGKLLGLPLNRALCDDDGNIYDVIVGTMMIVGCEDDHFCSLTAPQEEKYFEMFKRPQSFAAINGRLVVIPETNWRK